MSTKNRTRLASGFLSLALAACSSDKGAAPPSAPINAKDEKYLGLETPTDGFQVRDVGTTIPAGADEEYCEVAELPADVGAEIYVSSVELANGQGSHHLIVTAAVPGGPADTKLRTMSIGDRVPCVTAEMAFGSGLDGIGGIQHPYGKTKYPEGVSQRFYGGQRIVFDYHYYNTGSDPVEARSAVNFHLIDKSKVVQLGGGFGFTNWTIDTKPHTTGTFTADCRFQSDAHVFALTRHTHKWGRDFTAWFAGGANDGQEIWTTPDFETKTDYPFAEPVLVHAGEGFRFQCNYDNTEDHDLRFGTNATDEMCILFGGIADPNGGFEPPKEKCDVAWIDADGIGRAATVPGAFPPPDPTAVNLCLGGAASRDGGSNACAECSCNVCANTLIQCFTDADCGPIVQCATSGNACQPVIDQHSSGVGLSRQVAECVQAKCGGVCSGGDAGLN